MHTKTRSTLAGLTAASLFVLTACLAGSPVAAGGAIATLPTIHITGAANRGLAAAHKTFSQNKPKRLRLPTPVQAQASARKGAN
jgi:hypothetical protein